MGIYVRSYSDIISDLPGDVIDHILACLPFKEAVRTSTLSKKWKKQWYTVPQIIVDSIIFPAQYQKSMEGIIGYILTRHQGEIDKFSLSVDQVQDPFNLKMWICRLSQKSIQELTLLIQWGRRNEVPCDLFSCQQLRKLNLRFFEFKPAHSFKGFQNLISLQLNNVNITTAVFEKLIASCPVLEQLTVRNLSCIDHLHINVPSLKYFSFDGEFKSVIFNTPLLEVLSVNLYLIYSENNQFDVRFRFPGLPPSIKELYLRCQFQKFLAAGDTFTEVSTSYNHLKTLQLTAFCFEKLDDISCLISLMESSSNLEILDLTACNCKGGAVSETVLKFWEDRNHSSVSLNRLRKVAVRSFHGKDHEMKFVQFLLAIAPVLNELTIECMKNPKFDEDEIKSVLSLLCPESAELKFIKGGNYDSSSNESSDSSDSD